MSVRQHLDERSLSQIAAPAVLTAFIIHELFAQDHTLEPFIQRSSTSCEVHGLFVRLQVGAGRTKREDLKIQRQKCSACSCHFIIQSSDWLQEENIHSWKSCLFFICDVNVSNCNSLNSSLQLAATDLWNNGNLFRGHYLNINNKCEQQFKNEQIAKPRNRTNHKQYCSFNTDSFILNFLDFLNCIEPSFFFIFNPRDTVYPCNKLSKRRT